MTTNRKKKILDSFNVNYNIRSIRTNFQYRKKIWDLIRVAMIKFTTKKNGERLI